MVGYTQGGVVGCIYQGGIPAMYTRVGIPRYVHQGEYASHAPRVYTPPMLLGCIRLPVVYRTQWCTDRGVPTVVYRTQWCTNSGVCLPVCLSVPGFIGDSGLPLLARVSDITRTTVAGYCTFINF